MMEELITRIGNAAGISPETARNALGMILGFIEKEAPDVSNTLFSYFPGAPDLIATSKEASSGGLSDMIGNFLGSMGGAGGDIMALGGKLLGQGVSMDQAKTIAGEMLDFARQEGGEEHVNALLKSIPGLSKFL